MEYFILNTYTNSYKKIYSDIESNPESESSTNNEMDYMIFVNDILRLIIIIILSILLIHKYCKSSKNLKEKIYTIGNFMDFLIIIIYFFRFISKIYYSNYFISYESFIKFSDIYQNNDSFFTIQDYVEFYEIKNFYKNDKIWDIFLFFIAYIRSLSFIVFFEKIKNFVEFVLFSIRKYIYYMILFFFLFCSLAVLFLNLNFGTDDVNYARDYWGTLSALLWFCYGN
jgi:hypothetical protein